MSKEIEYKYLVIKENLEKYIKNLQPNKIIQGFLKDDEFFTQKSLVKIKNSGLEIAQEFIQIPVSDSREILKLKGQKHIVVRIRHVQENGYLLTIKGQGVELKDGLMERPEYEYEISQEIGEKLLKQCDTFIEKERYKIKFENDVWEVDIFNDGLIIAELEVPSKDYQFKIPDFIGKDVSTDIDYTNQELSKKRKKNERKL